MDGRLSEEVLNALSHIRDGLRAGLYHKPEPEELKPLNIRLKEINYHAPRFFSMVWWSISYQRSACCCIGGWLEVELGRKLFFEEAEKLSSLCYPDGEKVGRYAKISQARAADAIDRFLIRPDLDPWTEEPIDPHSKKKDRTSKKRG